MKIVYKIDLSEHIDLFALAHAVRQAKMNAEVALKNIEDKEDKTSLLCAKSVELLSNTLFHQFWERAHEMAGDEYIEHKATLNMQDGTVEFYDEKCDDCECDDSMDISEMLKNSGLETSDDHVERLADDLRNKRGGQA